MSTQPPGSSRRRRIAGERRGRALPEEQQSSPTPIAAPPTSKSTAPVTLSKKPEKQSEKPTRTTGKSTVASGVTDARPEQQPHLAADGADGSSGWWGSRASLLILTAVLVALLALAGLLALGLLGPDGVEDINEADAVEQSVRTAPAAAESAATAILAYDFRSLDADQDTAARSMTEEFAAEYADTFEKVVRPAAEKTRAKVTASVLATSVVRATEDTARVLLFVDQATTSTANVRPQIALNRVEMSLVREGDTWLVDDISSF
jgi:Mce-associated membrane protein